MEADMSCGQEARPITDELRQLENEIEQVEQLYKQLSSRLQPILRSSGDRPPSPPTDAKVAEPCSPMRGEVRGLGDRLRTLGNSCSTLLEDLDI